MASPPTRAAGATFRLFVSSTFEDLKEERNALQERVFPRLRELCQQHGSRFQAIDLRWGISEGRGGNTSKENAEVIVKHAYVMVLIVLGQLAACSRAFDPSAEAANLLKRDAEWADLASAGKDLEKIVSYWTDDALVMPPGQPVLEGKAAIRTFVGESLKIPGFKIHWVSEKVSFSPDGNLAYMRGTNEMTVPGLDGKLMTLHGRGVTVWRRKPDGQWRCTVDIWNDPPAAK